MKPNGAITYYVASFPEKEWTWCYSAREFERLLNSRLAGQKLRTILLDFGGWNNGLRYDVNVIDMSVIGHSSLLLFEKEVLELYVHTLGMVSYRFYPAEEVILKQELYTGKLPEILDLGVPAFVDISINPITYDFKDKPLKAVRVTPSFAWAFEIKGFDESLAEQAAEKNDLPDEVIFYTEHAAIRFSSDVEYYWIYIEKPETSLPER